MLPTLFWQTGWFLITFGHQWSFMADSVITEDITDLVDQFIVGFGLVSWQKGNYLVSLALSFKFHQAFSVIIAAHCWRASQINHARGLKKMLELALQPCLNICVIKTSQLRELKRLLSVLLDWIGCTDGFILRSKLWLKGTSWILIKGFLQQRLLFSSAGCESHRDDMTVSSSAQSDAINPNVWNVIQSVALNQYWSPSLHLSSFHFRCSRLPWITSGLCHVQHLISLWFN